MQSFLVAGTDRILRSDGEETTQEVVFVMIRNQSDLQSLLHLPDPRRVALGTSMALAMALGLAGAGTLLALDTAQHHQVAAVSQGSGPLATEAPLALNRPAR